MRKKLLEMKNGNQKEKQKLMKITTGDEPCCCLFIFSSVETWFLNWEDSARACITWWFFLSNSSFKDRKRASSCRAASNAFFSSWLNIIWPKYVKSVILFIIDMFAFLFTFLFIIHKKIRRWLESSPVKVRMWVETIHITLIVNDKGLESKRIDIWVHIHWQIT